MFSFYFGDLMWSPNAAAPTFGGDGLTIHYNLQYHATYGEGIWLESQYHPYRESLFLTDAQSVVAIAISSLRPVFPTIGDYAIGVSNALIFWSNVLSVLLLYLVFRRFGLPLWPALLFALLTALMAPQIMRQLGGQYTLGYTFLLPLTLLYQLSYRPGGGYWRWSLGMVVVITLLGLNNPYLYAIAVAYLLASAVFALLLHPRSAIQHEATRSKSGRGAQVQWLLVSALTTLVVYGIIRYFDYASDRTAVPFGFFHNVARWGGLLSNPDTFDYPAIRALLPELVTPRRENLLYLGLVPLLLLPALPLTLPYARARLPVFATNYLWMLAAGLAGLAFAFGLPFIYFPDWTYEHLGVVLQFRAPVRFAWPLYYVLSIGAGVGLWAIYLRLQHHKLLGATLLGVAILVWSVQAHQYSTGALDGHREHNAFHPSRLAETRRLADSLGIDTATYSSMYLLPSEIGWSDKVHRDGSWRSNHDGYKYSLASGVPLLNGKLSKVPLHVTLGGLELISNPLVRPSVLDVLDEKDILLVVSRENELLPGEAALAGFGSLVYQTDRLALRRVSPVDLRRRYSGRVDSLYAISISDMTQFLRTDFVGDDYVAFTGQESKRYEKGWSTIASLPLDTNLVQDTLELSVWNYADRRRFGGPTLYLNFLDAQGERIKELKQWANATPDTQSGWLRLSWQFTPPPGSASLELVGEYFYHYYLDELQLRPVDVHSRVPLAYGFALLDNYVVAIPPPHLSPPRLNFTPHQKSPP